MIQRIQSLYLVAVVALMATALLTPLAYFAAGSNIYELFAFELVNQADAAASQSTMYMGVVVALATIIPLITIFLYKNRMFEQLEFHTQGIRIAIIFPLVAIILDYLALRAIFKDEMLVRSLDRIR